MRISDRVRAIDRALLLAALLVAPSCNEIPASSSAALSGANEDDGEPPLYPAVVLVGEPGSDGCTGTLISPSHVLTAGHCMRDWPTSPHLVNFGYHPLGTPPTRSDGTRRIIDCAAHPDYDPDDADPPTLCGTNNPGTHLPDVVVLTLDLPVAPSWALWSSSFSIRADFHALVDPGAAPEMGASVTQVGFGLAGVSAPPSTAFYRRYRGNSLESFSGDTVRLAIGTLAPGDSGGPVLWDGAPPPVAGYAWREPPIGVAATATTTTGGRTYTSLLEPSNLDFVRSQLDLDGDGRFDYGGRTSRDFDWGCPGGFNPLATPENDPDGDGYLDATEDNAPGVYNHCQLDRDGDDVGDEVDNCQDHYNPGQGNSDPDRHGDRCDNCPFVTNEDQMDGDGDRIGDVCDICPGQADPLQDNCNADAETALGIDPKGDACDSVPCGDTVIGRRTEGTRELMDLVEVDALLADAEGPLNAGEELLGRTTFRFCRCNVANANTPEVRDACTRAQLPFSGECSLVNLAEHDSLTERRFWRWTTHRLADQLPRGHECPLNPDLCYRSVPIVLNPTLDTPYGAASGEPDRFTHWMLWDRDVPRWLAAAFFAPAAVETFPGGALPGILWTHTPGPSGSGAVDFDDPTSAYDTGDLDRTRFRQLASHYWSGGVLRPTVELPPRRSLPCILPVAPFFGLDGSCPFCGAEFPEPWVVFGSIATRCAAFDFANPLVQLGPTSIRPRDNLPLTGLDLFARSPGPFLAPAEPARWLGRSGVRYVSLDFNKYIITQTIRMVDGELVDDSGCGEFCEGPEVSALAAFDGPPFRVGAATVLSAVHERLWVIGGQGVFDGSVLHDVWSRAIDPEAEWRQLRLPEGVALGNVLSATYSPFDDALYVLDEVSGADRRLVRLDPLARTAEIVRSWPRASGNDTFALTTDPAGAIWIVGWSTEGRVHAALRFVRVNGRSIALDGWTIGQGRVFSGGARASDRGLTLVVDRGVQAGHEVMGHALDELRSGPGGERACF